MSRLVLQFHTGSPWWVWWHDNTQSSDLWISNIHYWDLEIAESTLGTLWTLWSFKIWTFLNSLIHQKLNSQCIDPIKVLAIIGQFSSLGVPMLIYKAYFYSFDVLACIFSRKLQVQSTTHNNFEKKILMKHTYMFCTAQEINLSNTVLNYFKIAIKWYVICMGLIKFKTKILLAIKAILLLNPCRAIQSMCTRSSF